MSVVVSENEDHNKSMNKMIRHIEDRKLYESPLPSEPHDLANWFSSYVYESPMLDTSDGLALSVPGESECIKETETTNVEGINVCPKFYEKNLSVLQRVKRAFLKCSGLSGLVTD